MRREEVRTIDYLLEYYPFDDNVLESVEVAARKQKGLSWPEFVRRYDVPEPQKFKPSTGNPIEVVDMRPTDYANTVMYHMPMGCQLDSNLMTHVVTMAHSMPDSRVISVGNPSKPGRSSGKLGLSDAIKVATGNLRPVVGPTLEYLSKSGIDEAVHIGESYGAEKTAASSEFAYSYDHNVSDAVVVEPVCTDGLVRTGIAFMQTGKHADKYLKPVRDNSDAFVNAEKIKESSIGWMVGLGRLSNLAIAYALGQQGFETRITKGLERNPEMKATISWGTSSELALNGITKATTDNLRDRFGPRVGAMPITDQTHAMNLDIFLNAAIALQSLNNHQSIG